MNRFATHGPLRSRLRRGKTALVQINEAEIDALIGPGTTEGIDVEAIEAAVRHAALGGRLSRGRPPSQRR